MEQNEIMVVQNNALAMEENGGFIADLTAKRVTAYSSMKPANVVESKAYFNAINAPAKRLGDCINEVINFKHVYVEVVQCTQQTTGEIQECPRIIIIDDKNVSYQCVSTGIFNGLKKIFQVFGTPEMWEKPLPIKVKQITKGEKKILSFEVK